MATEFTPIPLVDLTGGGSPTEDHTPVSPEPAHLDPAHLASFIEHMRHDADESEEAYSADLGREVEKMYAESLSGNLKPNPTDGTYMRRFRALKFNAMRDIGYSNKTPKESCNTSGRQYSTFSKERWVPLRKR